MVIVPDMVKLLNITSKKLNIKDLKMLIDAKALSGGEPYTNCCIPRKYSRSDLYDKQMEKLEAEEVKAILEPFKNSGHAFVCFDSLYSMNVCLRRFRMTLKDYIRLVYYHLKDSLCSYRKMKRERTHSTFIKFEDIDYNAYQKGEIGENVLIMS